MEKKSKQKDVDIISKAFKEQFNGVVDYIMAKRVGSNGKVEYLVKWDGYPERTATWEPVSNFASHQVVNKFESDLRKQLGINKKTAADDNDDNISGHQKTKVKKTGNKNRKTKCSEPMAAKLFDVMRKNKSKKCGKRFLVPTLKDVSPRKLFDVDICRIENVIKKYQPLVGASKRKSSRMSCPSSPAKNNNSNTSPQTIPLSQRSKRYQKRDLQKIPKMADLCTNDETNPTNNKSIKMKVNNDSNILMTENSRQPVVNNIFIDFGFDLENSSNENQSENNLSSKVFRTKLKERFSQQPEVYENFLDRILEHHKLYGQFRQILGNQTELIRSFFSIVLFDTNDINNCQNRAAIIQDIDVNELSDEKVEQRIDFWYKSVKSGLNRQQKKEFWQFIGDQSKEVVLKASPDYSLLKLNQLLGDHKDLIEEFEKFMPSFDY